MRMNGPNATSNVLASAETQFVNPLSRLAQFA